jgi:transcriptional regulator with XRE-family HTH domain
MNGTDLKAWRLKRKLSQAAVGRLLHVTTTTIYRWEAGLNPIPDLAAICLKFLPSGTIAQQRTYGRRRA